MSAHGERVLIAHLLDPDSLRVLALEGLDEACIPTVEFRPVVRWALAYYHRSGQRQAPSEQAMRAEFGDLLDDREVDFEPEDSIVWAIEDLKADYAHLEGQRFNKAMATDLAEAASADIPEVVSSYAHQLVVLSLRLEPKVGQVDARMGIVERIAQYSARASGDAVEPGLRFGWGLVDDHTNSIAPGELAVLAAGPKLGKSFAVVAIALAEWLAGRRVCLFSLENSPEMTIDRMICMGAQVSPRRWQEGALDNRELERVYLWAQRVQEADALWVLQPDRGRRSVEQMVREAQVRGASSVLIDQLTFVDLPDSRKPKTERIGDALHLLKSMISTGRQRLSCVIAHQISRDGVKAAEKVGGYEMHHMAESAEVERTADWVFALYRSLDALVARTATLQLLAARRAETKSWQMAWDIDAGIFGAEREVVI